MAFEVHYYDRRDKQRKIVCEEMEWSGPFWWSPDGNAGCDCNRSMFMYRDDEAKHLECSAMVNLILIEKIVHAGEIVYQEPITDLPERLVAMFVARSAFLSLTSCGNEIREAGVLDEAIEGLEECTKTLAACEDTAEIVAACEHALVCARKILAYEKDDSIELNLVAEWEDISDHYGDFAECVSEASTPFESA